MQCPLCPSNVSALLRSNGVIPKGLYAEPNWTIQQTQPAEIVDITLGLVPHLQIIGTSDASIADAKPKGHNINLLILYSYKYVLLHMALREEEQHLIWPNGWWKWKWQRITFIVGLATGGFTSFFKINIFIFGGGRWGFSNNDDMLNSKIHKISMK